MRTPMRAVWRIFALIVLAGLSLQLYFLGRVALMAVLGSYAGDCNVGLTMDAAAVQDPALLVRCLREGFDEVLALGAGA